MDEKMFQVYVYTIGTGIKGRCYTVSVKVSLKFLMTGKD